MYFPYFFHIRKNKLSILMIRKGEKNETTQATSNYRFFLKRKMHMCLNRKLYLYLFLVCVLTFLSFPAFAKANENEVKHIYVGDTMELEGNPLCRYSTSNENIVKVNNKGVITAVGCGDATVKVKMLLKTDVYHFRVTDPHLELENVFMRLGESYLVKVLDADKVEWKTDNINGLFYAGSVGEHQVIANADGQVLICKIKVLKPYIYNIDVEKGKSKVIDMGNFPDSAKFEIKDPNIAELNDKGEIIGKNVGETEIVSTVAGNRFSATIVVFGDQELRINGNGCPCNQEQILTIENYIPSYKVQWEGATDNGDGTATFKQEKEGDYTVKAVVDTGVDKVNLKKKIHVENLITETEKQVYLADTFILSEKEGVEYDYDDTFFVLQGNVFSVLKLGESTITARKDGMEQSCKVLVGDQGKGDEVIATALQYLGNPYVYGGASLEHGVDCSGFVMLIYKQFGIDLPHSSSEQRNYGTEVSGLENAKAGDVICYSGHVALYIGNNKIIHASNPREGIKISDNAAYRNIVTIRRMINE